MLDIVIVNWNAGYHLFRCVSSIRQHGTGLVSQIIIVDNGSTDGSLTAVEALGVHLIRSGENLGFARACNLGARQARSKYLLFLNPDAALYPDTLQVTLARMESPSGTSIGVCSVQLFDQDGHRSRPCRREPTFATVLASTIGVDRLFPQLGYAMVDWDHGETRDVDHVIGAFYLVRRRLFEDLGGFDERFFVYYEDLDLSLRVKRAGQRIVYLAEGRAFHVGGGTSRQAKARRLFYSMRSRILFAFKHFSFGKALVILLATAFLEPLLRGVIAAWSRSWSGVKETWIAYGMLLQWLARWTLNGKST